jgi:hypothetical protein
MELQELATRPALPLYIQKQLSRTKIGGADRDKVAVVDWMQQPDDVDDGKVTMHVSHSKYSTLLATRACQTQVLRDIAERKLRICDDAAYDDGNAPRLQCNLHCDGVVLSADQRIMIAERSKRTDAEQFLWTASFGEGMDWQRDRQLAGALHPERTVWRALKQELGLHEEWLKTRSSIATKVTLLEMGFSTHMQYILFSMVELPIDMDEALYRARNHRDDPAEQRSFSSMNFTVDECVSAVVDGHVEGKRLIDASRLGLWIACMHKF